VAGTRAARDGWALVRDALATADLRRMQMAWGACSLSTWALYLVVSIYAYDQGGAAAVGIAALVRLLPAGVAAPFAGVLADRHSRRDLLFASAAARAASLALVTALVAAGGPFAVVLLVAAFESVAATVFRPGQAALLPLLADTPRQLAAVNVFANALENVAFLVGAVAAGLLYAGPGAPWAFAATALPMAVAAGLLLAVPRDAVPAHRERRAGASVAAESLDGLRHVWAEPRLRLVVGVLSVTTAVEGAADVLIVVVALDLLDVGEAGLGWLNAAWAVGGLLGGGLVAVLLGGGRLAAGLAGGCLLAGAAVAGLAAWPAIAPALVLLGVLGVGYTLIEVAGETLLQRLAPDDVLGRVFGVVEGTYVATTAAGSILAPVAIALLGLEGALVAVGACLPLLALALWVPLGRLEAGVPIPERQFGLLRGISLFAPLPLATLETLAARMEPVPVADGDLVIRQGDPGDRFFVVGEGEVALSKRDGWRAVLRPGDFFGEIALLRDTPRTASAHGAGPGLLFALDRDDFLGAVTGHARAAEAADAVVEDRLAPPPAPAAGTGVRSG
jgi:MFS family permease